MIDARQHVSNPAGNYRVARSTRIGHAIHHSVSGGSFFLATNTTIADEINHIRMIDQYHVSLGFGGFGYHCATFPSDRSYLCGDWDGGRAHVARRNHELVGSVAIGNYSSRRATPVVLSGLAECVAAAEIHFGRNLAVNGHKVWALSTSPTACPGTIQQDIATIVALKEAEDMSLVNANGAIYALGAMGKRHIGPTEYAGWRAMGFTAKKVSKADLDKLPDWDDKVAATVFRPTGHPGAKLKTWIGSYDGHRKTATGRQSHTVVKKHMDDVARHSGGGVSTVEARAIAVTEDNKLKVTK